MRIRIQFITLPRLRILIFNLIRIHADPDPQHCVLVHFIKPFGLSNSQFDTKDQALSHKKTQ